jgi:microcystin-dependent protein
MYDVPTVHSGLSGRLDASVKSHHRAVLIHHDAPLVVRCTIYDKTTTFDMDFYIGQILMFGGNFAPRSFMFCQGQLMAISQFQALFAILGTQYGGDGRTTFALPDLRGRVPVGTGNGPGLTPRRNGQKFGQEDVTLTVNEMPSHNHTPVAYQGRSADLEAVPAGNTWGQSSESIYDTSTPSTPMNSNAISQTGGGQSHNNMQPSLGVNYIICIQGLFPPRN